MKKFLVILILLSVISGRQGRGQQLLPLLDSLVMDSKYLQVADLADSAIRSAASPAEKAVLENKKSEALIGLGKFSEAESLLNDLRREISQDRLSSRYMALTETNTAFLNLNTGRNDMAEENLQSAISHFRENHNENSLEAARALNLLGLVYMNTGKYNQALEQMQRALDIRSETTGRQQELIAASYNDLGLVESRIDPDRALDYDQKALTLYREIHGNSHPKIAIGITNLGVIYRDMGKYNNAISNFESALKIWEGIYPGPHPNKAFVIFNIGETYVKLGALNQALDNFNQALSMYRTVYGHKHPEIANVYNSIGNVSLSLGNYKEALDDFQSALAANIGDFNSADVRVNPPVRNYFNGNVMLYSLLFKAEALEAEYYGKSLRLSNLNLALKTLVLSDSLIDRLRQGSLNENDKIALGSLAGEVYAEGVRIATAAAMNVPFKKPYRDLAFFFAEKSKSAVLQEAITDTDAKSFAGIPADLLEKEKELKSSITLVSGKIATAGTSEEMEELRKNAFDLNREYEDFVKNLEKNYPEYYNLKFNSKAPSVDQVMGMLDPETAVLSYFLDEKNNRLYIFLISRTRFHIYDKPVTPDLDRMITGLRNSIYYDEIVSGKMTGKFLYDELIPKIPAPVRNLIILPAGRLSLVPFEALVTGYTQTGSYTQAPYLIKRYSIRYEFSAGLLLQKSGTVPVSNPSIFLCAPVSFPDAERLSDLPGTEAEVNAISRVFSERHLTASVYTGPRASESEIKSDDLKNYSYLHLATHGVVDESDPELSRVYLQPDEPREDGRLYAGEIYNIHLNASLVTLSACKTGLGKIAKGEGVIGLSRALIYAGAKNIIVSFWNVADVSTASLMKDFYENQLNNPMAGFSQNLRLAKLDLLNDNKYSAPYYWAPFILIGR